MSARSIMRELRASWAFIERNFNLTKRYWKWEVVFLVYTVANSVTMGFIGKGVESFSGATLDTNYLILYMLLGSILWGTCRYSLRTLQRQLLGSAEKRQLNTPLYGTDTQSKSPAERMCMRSFAG